jgi:hypothetical protein
MENVNYFIYPAQDWMTKKQNWIIRECRDYFAFESGYHRLNTPRKINLKRGIDFLKSLIVLNEPNPDYWANFNYW